MDKVHINLSPWQKIVWKDTHRYIIVNCGRRSGKTTMVAWKLFWLATQKDNQTLWYVAPTYKQAKQILWEMLLEMVPKAAIEKRNETELKIVLKNGSKIEVKGADNVDSLRGVHIDFCVFDECAFIDKWEMVWKVMRPTLADSKAACMFISTPNGFNHFKNLSNNVTNDGKIIFDAVDHSYHHFTTYENPYIDRGEIETMKREMNEDAFQQEIMGEFRKMQGLIYKEFKRELHMVEIPYDRFDTNWTYTRSIDFGFGHKTALLYFAISPDQTEIFCYDGLYVAGYNEKQISDVVKVKDKGKYMLYPVADSAAPMTISELEQNGVTFNPVEKGKDSVRNGIVRVAELLKIRNDTGKPTLMFNKYLTYIADEFERYRWIENKVDKALFREIPYKVLDDALDSIRYFAMSWKVKDKTYRHYNTNKWDINK
jgi:PBSX family phage terminase large subunit